MLPKAFVELALCSPTYCLPHFLHSRRQIRFLDLQFKGSRIRRSSLLIITPENVIDDSPCLPWMATFICQVDQHNNSILLVAKQCFIKHFQRIYIDCNHLKFKFFSIFLKENLQNCSTLYYICSVNCNFTVETVSLPHSLINLNIYPGETNFFVSRPLCSSWGAVLIQNLQKHCFPTHPPCINVIFKTYNSQGFSLKS